MTVCQIKLKRVLLIVKCYIINNSSQHLQRMQMKAVFGLKRSSCDRKTQWATYTNNFQYYCGANHSTEFEVSLD